MKFINYYWRLITTGFCFAVFGIGALTLVTTIFPVINIFVRSAQKRNKYTRKSIHLSWKFFVWLMSFFGIISVKTKGFKKLKSLKGCIIVANHPSLIDAVILISYIPQGDCIVKSSLANNFFMKGIIKAAYILNTSNFDELVSYCQKSLDSGNNLIIFPEGTRTIPGQESKFSRGAAHIAINTKKDIVPIKIECNPPGLLKNQKWYEISEKKMEFSLELKGRINTTKSLADAKNNQIAARKITAKIVTMLTK